MVGLQGMALFVFIPLVLWLFLAQPMGPGWSLVLGIGIVIGHRAVAGPWALRRARERCLWCGRPGHATREMPVLSGGRTVVFGVCDERHEDSARRFFGFVNGHRVLIGLGIFVPLLVLLGGTLLRSLGFSSLPHDINARQFRVIVAATVVLASLAYRTAPPSLEPRSAFPVHNLFLLGIGNTLWVFRLVGAWWLATEVLRLS
jgi:hypothetical protein